MTNTLRAFFVALLFSLGGRLSQLYVVILSEFPVVGLSEVFTSSSRVSSLLP